MNLQRVQVNLAPSEFGTCCDPYCYYSGEMQNMLYSAEMPNSPDAKLTRILDHTDNKFHMSK
jgi:hypothetical protein